VQILFRHGARAPFRDSPEAPDIWKTHLKADLTNAPSIELRDIENRTPIQRKVLHDSSNNDGKLRKYPFLCAAKGTGLTPCLRTVGGGLPVGALTQTGMDQAVELGGLIRSRYLQQPGFIGRDFDPSDPFPEEPPPRATAARDGPRAGKGRRGRTAA
jgi:hypothetical protein